MNERIQELAKKCGYWSGQTIEMNDVGIEKFALMIVQECIQQCVSVGDLAEQTNFGEMARKTKSTANGCAQMIKWRFGVE